MKSCRPDTQTAVDSRGRPGLGSMRTAGRSSVFRKSMDGHGARGRRSAAHSRSAARDHEHDGHGGKKIIYDKAKGIDLRKKTKPE